jgi:two-component system cell cycle response regulator DivK
VLVDEPGRPVILLVDDFTDALDMYEEYLTFHGYNVVTADNGARAVALARTSPPSLVFMDLRMPNMTGDQALRHLRADPSMSSVPVVAFTAHALEEERVAALAAGFDEVLPKPCLPNDLLAAVERLLKSPRTINES